MNVASNSTFEGAFINDVRARWWGLWSVMDILVDRGGDQVPNRSSFMRGGGRGDQEGLRQGVEVKASDESFFRRGWG